MRRRAGVGLCVGCGDGKGDRIPDLFSPRAKPLISRRRTTRLSACCTVRGTGRGTVRQALLDGSAVSLIVEPAASKTHSPTLSRALAVPNSGMRYGRHALRLFIVACLAAVLLGLTAPASLAQTPPALENARAEGLSAASERVPDYSVSVGKMAETPA